MSGGTSQQPNVGGILREHRDRIRALEANQSGQLEGPWHVVGALGEPPFENGWADAGDNEPATAFQKVGHRIYLRGAVSGGADNTTAFTLPDTYRPVGEEPFITDLEPQGIAKVRVFPDGSVVVVARLADVV